MHCWWNYSRMLGVIFGPRQTCPSCYYKASRSDLFPRYFCPADMLTLCGTLYISLLPMCVYSTYTQHSWSILCKLFNKSGQRINTRQSNSEHQRSAACFFFFFFYLPVKNPLPLMAIMTGKWQIFQNGRSTYIPLIKISFRDKRQSDRLLLLPFWYIFRNLQKHLVLWVFSFFAFLMFAAIPMLIQWKEKTNRNIYFLFITWRNRRIHLNNHFHCNDSQQEDMNIEVCVFVRVHPIKMIQISKETHRTNCSLLNWMN